MKSILVAYFLWLLGGPLGLYKFYLGRPLWDSCISSPVAGFSGLDRDFFTLPHQVQMANFLLQHQPERPSSAMRRELEHFKHLLYRQLAGDPNAATPAWRESLQEKVKPRFTTMNSCSNCYVRRKSTGDVYQ